MVSEKDIAFPNLSGVHIAQLASRGHRRAVRTGEVPFAEADRGFNFCVVGSGAVEILEGPRGRPHTVVVHGDDLGKSMSRSLRVRRG